MKRLLIVVAILGVLALAVAIVLPMFAKAKVSGGPGMRGNLRTLQALKDGWLAEGGTNEWPTGEDIYMTRGRSLNETLRRRRGELYFINRTGAPPFAYLPKAEGRPEQILILTSNGLVVLHP